MNIMKISDVNRPEVRSFFKQNWGSDEMVISSGVYSCALLDGFICMSDSEEIVGLITYVIKGNLCEVISLDSILENKGIGSVLVETVEKEAREQGCITVQLFTTNDNIDALRFYQKRRYRIIAVLSDAVARARVNKPSIPFIGNHGIPIVDELLMSKSLQKGGTHEAE